MRLRPLAKVAALNFPKMCSIQKSRSRLSNKSAAIGSREDCVYRQACFLKKVRGHNPES